MEFENEIFYGYKLDKTKITSYGFIFKDNHFYRSINLEVKPFRVDLIIDEKEVNGKIYDETFGDEYVLFRNNKVVGEFVGSIREAYKKVLLDIRKNCYSKTLFADEQATRIAKYIIKTYHDTPEFPWKKFPEFAIFRNKNNKRWYAVIMNVKDNVLGDNISARSIINIKPPQDKYQELIEQENIYPGWHMDKKSWITISLSDYFSDEYVEGLIDLSYQKIKDGK